MKLLFVGEKRSDRAVRLGLTWKDGGLAAKPLFEALRSCGLDPLKCEFTNAFERGGISFARNFEGTVIAMGRKAQAKLSKSGIEFIAITHPAARGAIRKRERYIAHVRAVLGL